MINLNELKAAVALYDHMDIMYENALDSIANDLKFNYLTITKARNGKPVAMYIDENHTGAIYIDTMKFITEEEIEQELC